MIGWEQCLGDDVDYFYMYNMSAKITTCPACQEEFYHKLLHSSSPASIAKYSYRCLDALKHLGYKGKHIFTTHKTLQKYMFAKSRGDAEQQEQMLDAFISTQDSTIKLIVLHAKRLKVHGEK